jgi:hypothetical protein
MDLQCLLTIVSLRLSDNKPIQADMMGQTATDCKAVGCVRTSSIDLNGSTQIQQLIAQGIPREQIFADT